MSEEKLERIETQLGQILQAIVSLDGRIVDLDNRVVGIDRRMVVLEDKMVVLEDKINGLDCQMVVLEDKIDGLDRRMVVLEDKIDGLDRRMTRIEDRVDIMEGTLLTTMRGGFNSLRGHINDIDVDLARSERKTEDNARKIRRLNQRLMYLEGRTEENSDFE